MKSDREQLRRRGMIEEADINNIISYSKNELIDRIYSESAVERSAAIRVLASRKLFLDSSLTELLLERLSIEKSLYTKIEICTVLEDGDRVTARKMISYLGKIGNNQYRDLPGKVSKKISYPLPRDIIARILGRIDIEIFPELLDVLQSKDEQKVSEVIDAIGFLTFYNQELSSIKTLKYITETINTYKNNKVIFWKYIICLSAFPLEESIDILNNIIITCDLSIIRDEAKRSLRILSSKMN